MSSNALQVKKVKLFFSRLVVAVGFRGKKQQQQHIDRKDELLV